MKYKNNFTYEMTANMKQELYRVKSHVNKVKKADSIVIPFITDTHAGINNRNLGFLKKTGYDHMQSVVNLTKILECDYVVHGGDIIDGSSITVDEAKQSLSEFINIMNKIDVPVFAMKGNHDDNSLGDTYDKQDLSGVISFSDLKSCVFDQSLHKGNLIVNKDDPEGAYGYYDDTKNKIRVLFFDSFNTKQKMNGKQYAFPLVSSKGWFANTQLNWIANAMKAIPKGYKSLIFSHTGIVDYRDTTSKIHPEVINAEAVQALIKGFESGSKVLYEGKNKDFPISLNIDFEGVKTQTYAWINGHVHGDHFKKIPQTQVSSIATLCSKPDPTETYQYRKFGTIYEDSFSVLVLTPSTKTLDIIRFGAGSSYSLSL